MINVGDTVFLKSGGPEMTVGKIAWGKAHVWWFQVSKSKTYEDTYMQREIIPVEALELVTTDVETVIV